MMSLKNKISLNLNNSPLSTSLEKLVFMIWLVPYIIISVISIFFLSHSLINKELEIAQSSFEITQNNLNGIITNVHNFSDILVENQQLKKVLSNNYTNENDVYDDYASVAFVDDYLKSMQEIAGYRIYVENDSLIENSFIMKVSENIRNKEWYTVAIRLRGQTFWMYQEDYVDHEKYLCLIRSLWDNQKGKFLGILVININPELVKERISSRLFKTVVLFNNEIIYNSSENDIPVQQQEKFINILKTYDFNNPKLVLLNKNLNAIGILSCKFSTENNINMNVKLAFVVPFKQLLSLSIKVMIYIIVILVLVGLLTVLLTRIFTSYIDSRVNKIQTGIKSVVSNNFAIPPTIGGNDEFQDIYHSLFEMSNNIKSLINQVYAQNLEKEQLASRQNEIRFKMLSTQINPHFLFNTLETIRMKSLATGDKEVATMLKQLAALLRYNLNITGKPVCFNDELTAVQNYLAIQRVRFGNRISHDIVVMCDIRKIQVLPLLIQPIIENSFSHGLENTGENGFIYVLCEIVRNGTEEILKISISDNGCGIEQNKLYELQELLDNSYRDDNTNSIGIFNVNSRIKLFYGQKYGLNIQSKVGEGTIVTIELPVFYIDN